MSSFTPSQRQAIELRGNVLVIAGAGTGKTRTLVERCIQWLLESPGEHSLDQVLMVTFTDAAAAEIRQRIREALEERLSQSAHRAYLAEQIALLETAFISTLHSFCFRLVRQHFYQLDLDPQLSICPEEEAHLLAQETLGGILEKHYAGGTPQAEAVQRLIHLQARGWDVPVKALVFRLHSYTQTLPDPNSWLTAQLQAFSQPDPKCWREWLQKAVLEWKNEWLSALAAVDADGPNLSACLAALRSLPSHPSPVQVQAALERIRAADEDWPKGSKSRIRDRVKAFFDEAEFLQGLTGSWVLSPDLREMLPAKGWTDQEQVRTEDPLLQDWSWVRTQMITLIELTMEFDRQFAQAKRELGVVDFHDLEQLSLRLLWDSTTGVASFLAEDWRKKLRLIFVDEYQDINAAQDAILCALGGEGRRANRFLVGDPKQSIYRFRLADPHIFQNYAAEWGQASSRGRVVALTDNFRSSQNILSFVNQFFAAVMRQEIGGVEYDDLARLRYGSDGFTEDNPGAVEGQVQGAGARLCGEVELHFRFTVNSERDIAPDDETEAYDAALVNLSNAESEARLIGLRLSELRGQNYPVWDTLTQRQRPIEWRDMVILLRAPRGKVEAYAKEFSRLGIPLITTRGGLFDSPAVTDLLSLLSLLDNPLQDVPLLAVLRSPFAALTLDELALVRLACKGKFWTALQHFHRALKDGPERFFSERESRCTDAGTPSKLATALQNPMVRQLAVSTWEKVHAFLSQFLEWRRLGRQTSLSQCLERILTQTQYTALLNEQPRAAQQRLNVSKLLTWARQFDQFQRQGLYRFLKFIEAQKQAQMDVEPALPDSEQAIRLMSIHQSKGLEFPLVVVADLGKPFNFIDLKAEIILDQVYGLCPLVKPPFTEQRYPSLPYWLAQRRQRRETLGEEMRLLYVAMTRARQYLILAGTAPQSALARWAKQPAPAPTRDLLAARNLLDWVGPWMSHTTGRSDWSGCPEGASALMRWRVYSQEDPRLRGPCPPARELAQEPGLLPSSRSAPGEELLRKLTWRYPFREATQQAAKLSVSTLRLAILSEATHALERGRTRFRSGALEGSRTRLDAAAVGSAHHAFLQFVSLDKLQDRAALQIEAQRMEREGVLSSSERAALDLEAIAAFWHSPIGQQILQHRAHLHREMPFTVRLPLTEVRAFRAQEVAALDDSSGRIQPADNILTQAGEKGVDLSDEFVVVTGVVDLVVLLPEAIWLLDFKTDAVTARDWDQKAKLYEPQMKLYALALSRIHRRPVTHCWLHSLALGSTRTASLPPTPTPTPNPTPNPNRKS